MIFYFSGTGNSKHVAEKVANHIGERLIDISENTIQGHEIYEVRKNEIIGFIFPVYWYSMPTIVEKFIQQLKLSGYQNQYIYSVATYGIAAGNVMDRVTQALTNKQLQLNGRFGVKMVDNYVVGYNIVNAEKQRTILENAEVEIDKVISIIKIRENKDYIKKGKIAFITPVTSSAYRKANHTRKFYATQNCNGCKQCERSCPCNVIHMVDSKPTWVGDCTFCLKCIHGCKQSAIQYGKFTKKRERYQYHMV
ncbi:EFR1 family ferrodoxin [Anaeromicropila herbilytica]|uniref:4Fe-4S ferredoxin n=1 Tax=Anaeromicropila herbilytica TaxID=2785025 RepID=A0A7R7IBY3_9FIRM|nr:EFR1 family ferrodoxin [Anaeromicropila herbilytica]BCN29286.1 4Fe-4S ferredoxin [Anaeromicropila herbilytica]